MRPPCPVLVIEVLSTEPVCLPDNQMIEEPKPSIDTSLMEHMLSLSHEERIEAHEAARQLVNDLHQAGREYYARQSKNSSSKTPKS